jgi:hypothetical protein
MSQRPLDFRINYQAPLAKGLVFAGLARHPHSTRFTDSSLHKNTGTLTNMDPPTDWVWVPELNRWSLDFDGSNDEVIAERNLDLGADDFSMAVWIKPLASGPYYGDLIAERSSYTNGEWYLQIFEQSGANRRPFFAAKNSAGTEVIRLDPTTAHAVTLGLWYHVAVVRHGSLATMYMNGVPVVEDTSATGTIANSELLRIGNANAAGHDFRGELADACIWKYARTPSEIQQLGDPSNVMLSGTIDYPRRKLWPVRIASTIRRPWQQRRHRRMTGAA